MIVGIIIPISDYTFRPGYPGYKLLFNIYDYNDQYYQYPNTWMCLVLAVLIGLAIVSLISVICSWSSEKNHISKKKIMLATLVFFFFFPMFGMWGGYEPMALDISYFITNALSNNAYGTFFSTGHINVFKLLPGFYLLAIGFALVLISLLLTTLIIFWNRGEKKIDLGITRYEGTSQGFAGFSFDLSLIFIGILSGIGIILGFAFPNYFWVYRTTPGEDRIYSELRPERLHFDGIDFLYKKYLDFTVLFYIILMSFVVISFLIYFLSKIRIIKKPITLAPAIFFMFVTMILPAPNPYGYGYFWIPTGVWILYYNMNLFYDAVRDLARYDEGIYDSRMVVGFFGYILLISILVMFIVLILSAAKSLVTNKKSQKGLVKEKIVED